MESATITTTAKDEIKAELQACHDQQSEIQGRIAAWAKKRDDSQQKLRDTDAQIKRLELQIDQIDMDISGLGARWAREELTLEAAQEKAATLVLAKDGAALKLQLLKSGRAVLEKRQESLVVDDPMTGRRPLADEMQADGKVGQQILFWELLEKYRQTGDENVERELMNKVVFCKFSEAELEHADQIYRHVLKERGLFCDFSSRQIGGYQKPAPWPGCR